MMLAVLDTATDAVRVYERKGKALRRVPQDEVAARAAAGLQNRLVEVDDQLAHETAFGMRDDPYRWRP